MYTRRCVRCVIRYEWVVLSRMLKIASDHWDIRIYTQSHQQQTHKHARSGDKHKKNGTKTSWNVHSDAVTSRFCYRYPGLISEFCTKRVCWIRQQEVCVCVWWGPALLVWSEEGRHFAADETDEGSREHLIGISSRVLVIVVGMRQHVEERLDQFPVLVKHRRKFTPAGYWGWNDSTRIQTNRF